MKLQAVGLCAVLGLAVGCGDSGVESEQAFLNFSTGALIGGSSVLTRYEDDKKVEGSGSITNLPAGNIITVWLVIFNIATECSPPSCGVEDVAPGVAAKAEVMKADDDIASAAGTMDFSYSILEGMHAVEGSTLADDFNIGLTSLTTSEIHYLVVDHGPPQAGREKGQRTNYTVGVNCTGGPMGNFCPFIQFAPHLAPGDTGMAGH